MDVVLAAKNTSFTFVSFTSLDGLEHFPGIVELGDFVFASCYRNSKATFDKFQWILYAFLLCSHIAGNALVSVDLKHLGFPDFPISEVFSNSPSMLTQNMAVIRSFNLFPALHSVSFSLRVLSGKTRKQFRFRPCCKYHMWRKPL